MHYTSRFSEELKSGRVFSKKETQLLMNVITLESRINEIDLCIKKMGSLKTLELRKTALTGKLYEITKHRGFNALF